MQNTRLQTPIAYLKGVGPSRAEVLQKELGISTYQDLINLFPNRYIDRTRFYKIAQLQPSKAEVQIVGQITGFKELGVKVPEDISVIGFSNWFMSSAITPSLTTIDQPGYKMGKVAFKRLYKELKKQKNNIKIIPKTIELKTNLIVRESTKN